jgi:hypothetical protein
MKSAANCFYFDKKCHSRILKKFMPNESYIDLKSARTGKNILIAEHIYIKVILEN